MAFQPAADIDEVRKAGSVALGKTIFAKAADLVEAALRKVAIVAAPHHALYHHVLQFIHHASATEGRHGLAQPVRLDAGEACGIQRDLHRLLLKDGHAQRAFEDAGELVRRAMFG